MNQEITYTCRFCKTTRTFEADTEGAIKLGMNVGLWIKNLCCERCGNYHWEKKKTIWKISKLCGVLAIARNQCSEDLKDVEKVVDERLTVLTKKLAHLVCDYHFVQRTWDREFVDSIMQCPDKFYAVIKVYVKGISEIPRENIVI